MALNEAYAAMAKVGNTELAEKYLNYTTTASDYLVRIQQVSSRSPQYNGVWFRGFDYEKWETYGSDGDAGWGIWCAETGWCQSWISATLSLQCMSTNIWDYTQTTTVGECFNDTAILMLNLDPSEIAPTVTANQTLRDNADPALILDGVQGSTSWSDGKWIGAEGVDITFDIDFGYTRGFDTLSLGFNQNMTIGACLPSSVSFYYSNDGSDYTLIGTWAGTTDVQTEYENRNEDGIIIDYATVTAESTVNARYLRIEIANAGTFTHDDHGAGTKTWLFTDELIIESNAAGMDDLAALLEASASVNLNQYQPATALAFYEAYEAALEYYNSENPDTDKLEEIYQNLLTAKDSLVAATAYTVTSSNPENALSWGNINGLVDGVYNTTKAGWKVLTNLSTMTEQEIEVIIDMGVSTSITAVGYAAESRPTYGKYLQNAHFYVSDSTDGEWTLVGEITGEVLKHKNTDASVSEMRVLGAAANGGEGRYVKVVFSRCADYEVGNKSEWLYLNEIMINEYAPVTVSAENATVKVTDGTGAELSVLGAIVGQTVNVSITPKDNTNLSSVTVNGSAVTVADNAFTLEEVSAAQTVSVKYANISEADLPVISGVKDWFITTDEAAGFDPLADITATDKTGKDISASVTVINSTVASATGKYTVTYQVSDDYGATVQASASVYVVSSQSKVHVVAATTLAGRYANHQTQVPKLVDGLYAPDPVTTYSDSAFIGWQNTAAIEIVIDLGGEMGIADLGYSLTANPGMGIIPPDVDLYVADEIGKWTYAGTIEAVYHPFEEMYSYDHINSTIALNNVKASYVKVVIRYDDSEEFAQKYYEDCVSAGSPGKGAKEWTFVDEIIINPYYSVTAEDTEGGAVEISTESDKGALWGEGATVTVTPEEGYVLTGLTVNGTALTATDGVYTVTNITEHKTVVATFARVGIGSAAVKLGDSISLIYYVTLDDAGDAVMQFTMNGKTYTVSGTAGSKASVYEFEFKNIAPQCMGDEIKAELLVGGEVIDTLESYSVKAYADAMLGNIEKKAIEGYTDAQYAALGTLIADMLAYGAAAQQYVGYKTDAPVNAGIEGASEYVPVTEELAAVCGDSTSDSLYFASAGVRFDYVNYVFVKINAASGEGVVIKVTDKSGATVEYALSDCTPTSEEGTYILYTEAIAPTEYGDAYTIELCKGGEVVQTLEYSVSAYVYYAQNLTDAQSGEPTDMAILARALHSFGVSAAAYKALI